MLDFNFLARKTIPELRRGMWVMAKNRECGILVAFNAQLEAEVHLVDAGTGDTREIRQVDVRDLRQARLGEIPAKRRPAPERGAKFGYR
jgi:hypothetical protein